MSYGSAELYALLNVSSVTDLLTESRYLWPSRIVPKDYVTGTVPPVHASTINFYRVAPVPCGSDYLDTTWSIQCRARTEGLAEALAEAVKDAVNRKSDSAVYFVASVLQVIPPSDDEIDNFNVPVEVRTKGRDI